MKIGITGASGFIGTNLVAELKNTNHIVDTFWRGYSYAEEFVRDNDVIVHLAGVNKGSHEEMIDINVKMTLNLIDLCYKHQKKFLYAGTSYDKKDSYALSKDIAKKTILSYIEHFDCDFYHLSIPKVIGKGCKPFYNSFVTTMAYMRAKGDNSYKEKIKDYHEYLKLIWVDDLCKEIIYMIERTDQKEWNEHAKLFIRSIGITNWFNMKMGEVECYVAGIHPAIEKKYGIHWQKFTELVEYYKTYELPKA